MSWGELLLVIGFGLPVALALWAALLVLLAVAVKAVFCGLEEE
jgi:hypothetical protein